MHHLLICQTCKKEFIQKNKYYRSKCCSKYCSARLISSKLKGKIPKNLQSLHRDKDKLRKRLRRNYKKFRENETKFLQYKKNLSEARLGSKGSNWQGGKTEINKLIRNSLEYRLWREAVFKRDNWTCRDCGVRGGKLHPDHIMPFAFYEDLRFEVYNGRTLCEDCHHKTETWGLKSFKQYENILR